jgi:hypothetical protein
MVAVMAAAKTGTERSNNNTTKRNKKDAEADNNRTGQQTDVASLAWTNPALALALIKKVQQMQVLLQASTAEFQIHSICV